jgi:hypothetical protein
MSPPFPTPQDFLRHWHVLVYVEGVIYQMDEHNESLAAAQVAGEVQLPGARGGRPAAPCPGRPPPPLAACWQAN